MKNLIKSIALFILVACAAFGQSQIIDCDKLPNPVQPDPFVNLTILSHKKMGKINWDVSKVDLYLSKEQKEHDIMVLGGTLQKELASKKVMNACVLDWLVANPSLVPKEWHDSQIFFWGTIYLATYQDKTTLKVVRYLLVDERGERISVGHYPIEETWTSWKKAAYFK